jgi:peptide/nickel transport system permease protein
MPSTELEAPLFTRIVWSDRSNGVFDVRLRTVGFVLAVAALAAVFTYDYVVSPPALIGTWDLTRMDWVFFLSCILFVRYGVVPLASDWERSSSTVKSFLRRPAGVLSLAYILAFSILGLVGPELLGMPRVDFYANIQPPVWGTVNVNNVNPYNCVGPVTGDICHGTWQYPLGTTRVGENMVNVIMYSAHIALKLSLAAAMIMVVVATAVGATAGYFGGWVDDVLMRYVDVQQTIPAIVVYIIIATMYLGKDLFTLALIFGLLNWGGIARLVRSETLERREKGYVRAARSAGASDLHVLRRHIIPNSTATVVTALTRQIPLLILAQVALAYLKLNTVALRSLGGILRRSLHGRYIAWDKKWWVIGFATLFLVLTVLAFNVFGDTARDVLDPKEVA